MSAGTGWHCNTQCNTHYNTLQPTVSMSVGTGWHCNTHCTTYYFTHCNTATHCNTLQHTATHCNPQFRMSAGTWWQRGIGFLMCIGLFPQKSPIISGSFAERDLQLKTSYASSPPGTLFWFAKMIRFETHCNTLQHTATHCNTMQHPATQCNTLQHPASPYNTLQHPATPCNTLQHPAIPCNTLQHTAKHCSTQQHTATHSNTLCTGFQRVQKSVPRLRFASRLFLE